MGKDQDRGVKYVSIHQSIPNLERDIESIQRCIEEKRREVEIHTKILLQSVGREVNERYFRVEDSVVHVQFDVERGPSVRLVKLS